MHLLCFGSTRPNPRLSQVRRGPAWALGLYPGWMYVQPAFVGLGVVFVIVGLRRERSRRVAEAIL